MTVRCILGISESPLLFRHLKNSNHLTGQSYPCAASYHAAPHVRQPARSSRPVPASGSYSDRRTWTLPRLAVEQTGCSDCHETALKPGSPCQSVSKTRMNNLVIGRGAVMNVLCSAQMPVMSSAFLSFKLRGKGNAKMPTDGRKIG